MPLNFRKKKIWIAVLFLSVVLSIALIDVWSYKDVSADEDYSELKVFTEVLSVVKNNYVENVSTKDLVYAAIKGMLNSLDPHSGFMAPDDYKEMQVDTKGEFGGLGIQIGMKDDILTVISPIEDTPAFKAGIKAGDKILKINGESTKGMQLFDAVKKMRGPKGTPVTLSIYREGFKEPRDFTVVRDVITIKSVKYKMLDKEDGIGYIKLTQFQEKSADEMAAALKDLHKQGLRSLILDLRNNPGGLLNSAVDISSQFLPAGKLVVYIKGRTGGKTEYRTFGQYPTYDTIPMIVLVNEGSASASEIVSGALKDWQRAVILGTQTFGKGSVQTVIPLSDGSGLRLTTARYYTPKGISIQNTGIKPDIEVKLALYTKDGKPVKEHPILRERDLKNHLDAASQKGKSEKLDEETEAIPFTELKEADDNQLQRAEDILKTWDVFKKLPKAS
ncbi:MAG: S41 family peptidase [Nitrospiraceae bacterium]|nr:S41 family peptidase [Nitrospiraceae bacterium]